MQRERSGLRPLRRLEVHQPTLVEDDVVDAPRRPRRPHRRRVARTERTTRGFASRRAGRRRPPTTRAPDPDFPGLAPPAAPPGVDGLGRGDRGPRARRPGAPARRARSSASDARPLRLLHERRRRSSPSPRPTGLAVSQATDRRDRRSRSPPTTARPATRSATSWRAGELDPPARRARGRREGGAHARSRRARAGHATGPSSSRTPSASCSGTSPPTRLARSALLEERSYLRGTARRAGRSTRRSRSPTTRSTRAASRRRSTSRACPSSASRSSRPASPADVVWDRRDREARAGRESTGHAPPARLAGARARSRSRSRSPAGEADSPDELAELVGDGIYVTRLHYLSIVDAREGVITGMTRDGTFRIRRRPGGASRSSTCASRRRCRSCCRASRPDARDRARELRTTSTTSATRRLLAPAVATARFDVTGTGSGPGSDRRVVDRAELVLAPAAQARRDQARIGDPRDRDDELTVAGELPQRLRPGVWSREAFEPAFGAPARDRAEAEVAPRRDEQVACRTRASGRSARRSARRRAATTGSACAPPGGRSRRRPRSACHDWRDPLPAEPRTRARAPGSRRGRPCRRRRRAPRRGRAARRRRRRPPADAGRERAGPSWRSSLAARMSPSGTGASSRLAGRKLPQRLRTAAASAPRRASRSAPRPRGSGSPRSAGTVRARRAARRRPASVGTGGRNRGGAVPRRAFVRQARRCVAPANSFARRSCAAIAPACRQRRRHAMPVSRQLVQQAGPQRAVLRRCGAASRTAFAPGRSRRACRARSGSSGQSTSASATRTTFAGPLVGSGTARFGEDELQPAAASASTASAAARRLCTGYWSRWKSTTVFAANRIATAIVRRVRFRSTMCVPPCEAGVKPIPPKPVSRPECIRIRAISAQREAPG